MENLDSDLLELKNIYLFQSLALLLIQEKPERKISLVEILKQAAEHQRALDKETSTGLNMRAAKFLDEMAKDIEEIAE